MTQEQRETQETESRAVQRWEDSGVPAATVGMARALFQSGYFKNVTSVAQAIVKIEMGKELGITPVEAMQFLHIFVTGEGTRRERTAIHLGYPLVGSLIQRSGKYHYDVRRRDEEGCEIDFYRILQDGNMRKLGTSRFTIERARKVGLIRDASTWTNYPEIMLFARALCHGARTFCPEILGGAGVSADEPYIEGQAQLLNNDEATEPPTIEEPPEGFTNPWSRFWAFAKEPPPGGLGLTEEDVHAFFNVDSLKDAAMAIMETSDKTEAEVVAEFERALREAHPTPSGPQQEPLPEPEPAS